MKVSELARTAGVTAETVRYYARIGLLVPTKDPDNGYQRFQAADKVRLSFVLRAKRLGFQLDEIAEILGMSDSGQTPCPAVREIVQRRVIETRQHLADTLALQARLEQALTLWEQMPDGDPDGHAVCALIEAAGTRETDA